MGAKVGENVGFTVGALVGYVGEFDGEWEGVEVGAVQYISKIKTTNIVYAMGMQVWVYLGP